MTAAVALIAKAPRSGRVKTRLCPPLEPDQAAAVACALLADTAAAAAGVGADVWCAHAGPAAPLRSVLGPDVPLLAQRGRGLGARLAGAQGDLFARGYDRVVLLGADCPTVEARYLRTVLRALDRSTVVIGPAADGGYTLLASTRPTALLLDGLPMGDQHVLGRTLARARRAGIAVRVLPVRHDLDTAEDFRAAAACGQLSHAPLTRAVATSLGLVHPAAAPTTATAGRIRP